MTEKRKAEIHFEELNRAMHHLYKNDMIFIDQALDILRRVRDKRGMVWVMGNGGSAATASHLSVDLTKACGIRAIALPDLVPMHTAYANDNAYGFAFRDMLLALYKTDDVVFGISCSGNSANVVQAMPLSLSSRARRIVLTGNDKKSKLAISQPDVIIHAEAEAIEVQEDIHNIVCHALVRQLKTEKK